ncbi:hypothetical protein [Azorhizobium sp. AG788]|uniref:hypothetical protein n=1 Tax=Azorhizobium sp. AG788 TaxID=2183897 RepID=UPI003138D45F
MPFHPQSPLSMPAPLDDRIEHRAHPQKAATSLRVRIVLTQGARAHVLQAGLSKRLSLLMERADGLHAALLPGDRIGLSESTRHDLFILRRRIVIEAIDTVLELILDVPSTAI